MANFVTARPVVWADGVAVNGNDLRAGRAALLTPGATALSVRGGVLPGPGNPGLISALVTPAMQVTVKAGSYVIPSVSATGGGYTLVVDQDANLDITASNGSNPRTDLVIAEVVDLGTALSTYQVRVLTGTAGPGAPRPTNTTPNAHYVVVGSVDVRALAESSGFIRAQDVHDERPFTVARGGILPVANQAERDAIVAYEGMVIERLDTGNIERYHAGAWGASSDVTALTGALAIEAFTGMGMANTAPLTPPAGVKIFGRVGTFTGTVAGSNVLGPIVFPTPFPNGLLAVFPVILAGTGVAPVINGATPISRTEFSVFLLGAGGSVNVTVGYLALGW